MDYVLNIRKFLNKPGFHSGAYVIARLSSERDRQADLEIADCSRKISLSLGLWSKKERQNTLYKLDLLIDSITKLRQAVADRIKELDEAKSKKKERRRPSPANCGAGECAVRG